ncbi:MAG: hypothetical protein AB8C84_01585 [Oligoflexales bacterium]
MSASALNTLLPPPPSAPNIGAQKPSVINDKQEGDTSPNFMDTAEAQPIKTTEKTRNIINSLVQKSRNNGTENEFTEIFGEDYEATANIPVLALLIDRLEQVTPESIPKVITENPFIQQSLSNPIETVLQKEMSIAEIAEMINLPPKVLTKALQKGFSLEKKTTPLKFFKAIGIDPQKVIKGLNRLRHKLTKDGIPHYVARAKAVQIQNFGKTFKKDEEKISELEQSAHEISKKQNFVNQHNQTHTPLKEQQPEEKKINKSEPIKLAQGFSTHTKNNLSGPQHNPSNTPHKINNQQTINHLQKLKKIEGNNHSQNPLRMMNHSQKPHQLQIPKNPSQDHKKNLAMMTHAKNIESHTEQKKEQNLEPSDAQLTAFIKNQNKKSIVPSNEVQQLPNDDTLPIFSNAINKKTGNSINNQSNSEYSSTENQPLQRLSLDQTQIKETDTASVTHPKNNVLNTPPDSDTVRTHASDKNDTETKLNSPNTLQEDNIKNTEPKKEISSVMKTANIQKTLDAKAIQNISNEDHKEEKSNERESEQSHQESQNPTSQKIIPQAPVSFEEIATHFHEQDSIDTLPTQKAAQKILERSQLLVEEGGGTIFIDLQEEMGHQEGIGLSVQIDGDDVRIKVVAQSDELKEKISAGLPVLQNKLNDHQMKLVSVDLGTESESQNHQDENLYEGQNQDFSQNTPSEQSEKQIDWDNIETNLRPIQLKSLEKDLIQNIENRYMPRTSTIQIHT